MLYISDKAEMAPTFVVDDASHDINVLESRYV